MWSFPSERVACRLGSSVLLVSLAAGCGWAEATGFFLGEHSVRGLGRVNAGVAAAADDAGTIFFNAAGLTQLWKAPERSDTNNLVSVGGYLVVPRSDFSNSGSVAASPGTSGASVPYFGTEFRDPTDPSPVLNAYYARRLDIPGAYVGFGITSPFGLTATFNNGWFGRYDTREASLTTVNFTAVAAYEVTPSWSVGVGLDLQYAHAELTTAIPDPLAPGGPTPLTDGQSKVSGSAWTPGFNIGLLFTPDSVTRIGLALRSGIDHDVDGTATTSGLTGPLSGGNGTVGVSARLKLPTIVSLGAARRVTEDLTVFGQVDWFGWNTFDEIRIGFADGRPDAVLPENYRDTWALSMGTDYTTSESLTLRGGIRFDRTPTVDGFRDTTFPDGDRVWFGLGATYRVSRTSSLDFAFNHVLVRQSNVAVTRTFFDATPLATTVRVNATVDQYFSTIGISYNYAY
jgi:long-chain fatty acid transport protein